CRLLRAGIKREVGDRRPPRADEFFPVSGGVAQLEGLGVLRQRTGPCEALRLNAGRAAVDEQRRGLVEARSAYADNGASRSTSMPLVNDWSRCTKLGSMAWSRSGWLAMSRARKPRNWPSTGSFSAEGCARVSTTSPLARMV